MLVIYSLFCCLTKAAHPQTKSLVLISLSRAPSTPFFFTVFPQPITLNPGMSVTLPVIFRPSKKVKQQQHHNCSQCSGCVLGQGSGPVPLLSFLIRFHLNAWVLGEIPAYRRSGQNDLPDLSTSSLPEGALVPDVSAEFGSSYERNPRKKYPQFFMYYFCLSTQ